MSEARFTIVDKNLRIAIVKGPAPNIRDFELPASANPLTKDLGFFASPDRQEEMRHWNHRAKMERLQKKVERDTAKLRRREEKLKESRKRRANNEEEGEFSGDEASGEMEVDDGRRVEEQPAKKKRRPSTAPSSGAVKAGM